MLYLHRSERADGLLGPLAEVLTEPLSDPFESEVICVPTRGIERWISQGLAAYVGASEGRSDGVSANIEFPPPGALVSAIVSRASGRDPKTDPWINGQILWALLDAIDTNMHADWMHLVADQVRASEQRGASNRVRTARYVANLFSRYHELRPSMVRSWAQGREVGPTEEVLEPRLAWQPRLWLEMRDRMGAASPPELAANACDALESGNALLELPARVSAFGLTRIPQSQLQILRAVAVRRDVHLFLLHPSPALWDAVTDQAAAIATIPTRSQDRSRGAAVNPLLASWARDAREMQVVLAAGDRDRWPQVERHHALPARDGEQRTLLRRLQSDIYANQAPPSFPDASNDARPIWEPDVDRSVQVHACHGPGRQVEVLRDVILDLLETDPTLEPRDIIVMCPDVETFAPLIHATFGATPQLRVRLADRSLTQTNPLLSAVAELLALIGSRAGATEVTSLMGAAAVRARFGFADDDLARIQDWVADSGIRWGMDDTHRGVWNVAGVAENTWRAGLDRILLGVTMADQDLQMFKTVRPLDDLNSNDIGLVGRLAEFTTRLGECVESFSAPTTLADGLALLIDSVDALMLADGPDAWQREELQRIVDELLPADAAVSTQRLQLSFAELRDLLLDQMRGRPTRANFRTGHITVCTLMPMRSVPHRVICVLGLDDETFPRTSRRSGDDLTQDDPMVGDHDGRGEDRQLLLDALLATTDTLVVTYSGRDELSNAIKQPAVPLAELITVINQTVNVARPGGVVTHHPLQSFDTRNFTAGALAAGRAFSYDQAAFKGALALTRPRREPPPFLAGPIAASATDHLDLVDLVGFAAHPTKSFVRSRLGINLADYDEPLVDQFDIDMDGLKQWSAGQHLVEALTGQRNAPRSESGLGWFLGEMASGDYPPGKIVTEQLRGLYKPAAIVADHTLAAQAGSPPATMPVRTELPDGTWLVGSVSGVCEDRLIETTFSKLDRLYQPQYPGVWLHRAKPRVSAWIRLLALAASYPQQQFSARVIGRDKNGTKALMFDLQPPADPVATLGRIVSLYTRNQSSPLPLFCETSHAYVRGLERDRAEQYVSCTWNSSFSVPGEDADEYHLLVMEPIPSAEELAANPDFAECAQLLWDPLLANETIPPVTS